MDWFFQIMFVHSSKRSPLMLTIIVTKSRTSVVKKRFFILLISVFFCRKPTISISDEVSCFFDPTHLRIPRKEFLGCMATIEMLY